MVAARDEMERVEAMAEQCPRSSPSEVGAVASHAERRARAESGIDVVVGRGSASGSASRVPAGRPRRAMR